MFSYLLGVIADRKGRKPVIIVSAVFTAIASLVFGHSVHIVMAILARFIMGVFHGEL